MTSLESTLSRSPPTPPQPSRRSPLLPGGHGFPVPAWPSSGVTPTGEGEGERGRANKKEQGHVPPPSLASSLPLEPLVYCFIEPAEGATRTLITCTFSTATL